MKRFTFAAIALGALASCAHSRGSAGQPKDGSSDEEPRVAEKTVVERLPDGTTRTTLITTTTRTVEAPSPPPRPADPLPPDPLIRYNLELLNRYRASSGVPPLLFDAAITRFALDGSKQLSADHSPHAHCEAKCKGARGFGTHYAENQGDPNGVPAMDSDAVASGKKQIALLLKLMMDEGPGGGHHDNMLNAKYRRVGIGLFYARGRLYLTNDFSD